MALPCIDPSLPTAPAPIFTDVDAVRGDHMRANNNQIWQDLQYLEDYIISIKDAVGVIKMYDGAAWTDNVTMPGWYACIAANSGVGCPNLVDKFILGGIFADKGTTGGSATKTIAEVNLPSHVHSANHTHTASSGNNSVGHTHTANHTHTVSTTGNAGALTDFMLGDSSGSTKNITLNVNTGAESAAHTHAITVNTTTMNTGAAGSGTALDITPPYYKVLFIRKCA